MKQTKKISVIEDEDGTYNDVARHIFGLCNKILPTMQNEFFARWYLTAFPEKKTAYEQEKWFDDTYCIQWISRFATGTPTLYMDRQRLKAYLDVAIAWNQSKLKVIDTEETHTDSDAEVISRRENKTHNHSVDDVSDKTKVLLEWDDKKGRMREYILNKSLQQPSEDKEYYVATQFIGYHDLRIGKKEVTK